ncbi:MAG: type VI secretion system baseplate subunit TssE, partial [bacterium]
MPRSRNKQTYTPSLLDRLLHSQSAESSSDGEVSWDLRRIIESVRMDLEALLNTRLEIEQEPLPEYTEVRRSLLTYGLPDLTSFQLKSAQEKRRLTRTIEHVIRTFEPRLQRVRVTLVSPIEDHSTLHFSIEGLLRTEPAPEHVAFDTSLELSTGEY